MGALSDRFSIGPVFLLPTATSFVGFVLCLAGRRKSIEEFYIQNRRLFSLSAAAPRGTKEAFCFSFTRAVQRRQTVLPRVFLDLPNVQFMLSARWFAVAGQIQQMKRPLLMNIIQKCSLLSIFLLTQCQKRCILQILTQCQKRFQVYIRIWKGGPSTGGDQPWRQREKGSRKRPGEKKFWTPATSCMNCRGSAKSASRTSAARPASRAPPSTIILGQRKKFFLGCSQESMNCGWATWKSWRVPQRR